MFSLTGCGIWRTNEDMSKHHHADPVQKMVKGMTEAEANPTLVGPEEEELNLNGII